jgi:predicted nuclease with TOPRIM domain
MQSCVRRPEQWQFAHAAPWAMTQVEKSKAAVDECSETLSEYESQHSRLQATQDVVKQQEGERSKLANMIADTYGMDKALVVSLHHHRVRGA